MERFERRQRNSSGIWGVLSFLGFLVIIGLTFSTYPNVIDRIASYFSELATLGRLVLPPANLGQPLIYFLNLSGIWQIILGALRLASARNARGAISDVVSGAYALYLAHLFSEFYGRIIAGHSLVFYGLLGLAGVIIVDIVLWAISWQLE
jgi:hypothetical protein